MQFWLTAHRKYTFHDILQVLLLITVLHFSKFETGKLQNYKHKKAGVDVTHEHILLDS